MSLLLVGLVCVGLAIVITVATVGVEVKARHQVDQVLSTVRKTGVAAPRAKVSLSDSFGRRVFAPATLALTALARRLSGADVATRTQARLDLAGNPGGWDVGRILACKGLGLIAGLGLLVLMFGHTKLFNAILFGGGLAAAGFFLPDILLKNVGLKRQERIQRTLPDSLDMLTISVEAGLAFDAALSQVAVNAPGPVGAEFARVLQEMRIGRGRGDAFRSLQTRTTVPEFRSFVAAIVQADAFGIPIANVLRSQSKEMRLKRRQRAEEQAQKVPLKIMFPVVLCIFPALFVVVLGPGVIGVFNAFHH